MHGRARRRRRGSSGPVGFFTDRLTVILIGYSAIVAVSLILLVLFSQLRSVVDLERRIAETDEEMTTLFSEHQVKMENAVHMLEGYGIRDLYFQTLIRSAGKDVAQKRHVNAHRLFVLAASRSLYLLYERGGDVPDAAIAYLYTYVYAPIHYLEDATREYNIMVAMYNRYVNSPVTGRFLRLIGYRSKVYDTFRFLVMLSDLNPEGESTH